MIGDNLGTDIKGACSSKDGNVSTCSLTIRGFLTKNLDANFIQAVSMLECWLLFG